MRTSLLTSVDVLVGTLLVLGSFFVIFPWGLYIEPLFRMLYLSREVSEFSLSLLDTGPSIALAGMGLVLYAAGRRAFWSVDRKRVVQVPLGIIGAFQAILGGLAVFYYYLGTVLHGFWKYFDTPWQKPIEYYLGGYFPYFVSGVLLLIAGLLLLIDAHRNSEF